MLMMLISGKCQSTVCFLSSDGAPKGKEGGRGQWIIIKVTRPLNQTAQITILSLSPIALFCSPCMQIGAGQFARWHDTVSGDMTRRSTGSSGETKKTKKRGKKKKTTQKCMERWLVRNNKESWILVLTKSHKSGYTVAPRGFKAMHINEDGMCF